MRTSDLRERLVDAFQREVDLNALKLHRSPSRSGEMDAASAYDLANIALGVIDREPGKQSKADS